ncbi:MAG: hypothetical protein FXF47_01170 [Candidatus Mcinerneyibacterium aminivorans]|uniref:Ribosome maturation factor RimP n=1 Tax=Candidatus Mcinerneyibacterium aminivorans TaxID=2703815 RepID=A0A5D0ML63_9BACT|nr:MAG: hypothetical protein FXF47_01170 [Candidatus Mcinerneyibacterium aminivorans]
MKIDKQIVDLIKPYLDKKGYRLYKIEVNDRRKNGNVKLYIDSKEGSINVDELQEVNRYLGDILDAEDLIKNSYVLEVSSPGLVSLKTDWDFDFFEGRYCRVIHKNGEDKGYIKGHSDKLLILENDCQEKIEIKREHIRKAILTLKE